MKFYVQARYSAPQSRQSAPYVILTMDNWNDYGFRTTFEAKLYLISGNVINLGAVKFLSIDGSTKTELPNSFEQLESSFCSLGSSLDYYELLAELPKTIQEKYLRAVNDSATNLEILQRYSELEGFNTSLLRDPAAEEALRVAPTLFRGIEFKQDVIFSYETPRKCRLTLSYSSEGPIEKRLHAIVGYNGSGKTKLLSDLAHVASASPKKRATPGWANKWGQISPIHQRFASTIAVSFSAFDTFDIPKDMSKRTDSDEQYAYVYCGLRRRDEFGELSRDLKNESDRSDAISDVIRDISTDKRRKTLDKSLSALFAETSMRSNLPSNMSSPAHLLEVQGHFFANMSSGHQIAIEMIVNLVAGLRVGSLALIDEPESHLHPPLLAAVMKAILIALEDTDSFVLIATHSPIVLQEIPRTCVHILKRDGPYQTFSNPRLETFGENLDVITAEAFHLDDSESTYVGTLRALVEKHSFEEVDDLFSVGLSRQGAAVLRQLFALRNQRAIDKHD